MSSPNFILFPRPKIKEIPRMAQQCDVFVTLLNDTEEPKGIGEAVKATHAEWLHFPLSKHQPREVFFENSLSAVKAIIERVNLGRNILIHCAAGIDRTGTIALASLLCLGFTLSQAKRRIGDLRPKTLASLNKHTKNAQIIHELYLKSK